MVTELSKVACGLTDNKKLSSLGKPGPYSWSRIGIKGCCSSLCGGGVIVNTCKRYCFGNIFVATCFAEYVLG